MKKIILSIAAGGILASCGTIANTTKTKVGTSQPALSDTSWTLADNVKGRKPTLLIATDGKISGKAQCNGYFATATIDATAGNFSAKNIGSTMMSCENLSGEMTYLKMLEEANKYVVTGNTLELYKNNLLLMKFVKQ